MAYTSDKSIDTETCPLNNQLIEQSLLIVLGIHVKKKSSVAIVATQQHSIPGEEGS